MLYIISTPIGNIEDITYRAIRILKEVDYILCEDTRRTGKLLKHYEIKNKLVSYNDFNKEKKTKFVINDLKNNDSSSVAIVSDSGTPGINDPGFYLVRECVRNNIVISPIPGASAFISALVCSGLPTDKFTFYGFFPKKQGKKKEILNQIKERKETAIFYESPHRIEKTMKLISESLKESQVVVGRELTKKFETFYRGKAQNFPKIKVKGEFTVLVY